ncbi:MAG: recombinase [Candidatus Eremiobacteraeota bacterium]|nr:recombinase [Candidatus Eremiobacteraeota bacterium]
MDDYEEWEKECERTREENEKILDGFETWLRKKNFKDKTIDKHISNIDFYINEYLLYEDVIEAKDGANEVSMFLGYWFIKKAMWSSPAQIKSNASSLKKFYTFMLEKEMIEKDDLNHLKETIKKGIPGWVATMKRYDDPSITDMGVIWGLDDY